MSHVRDAAQCLLEERGFEVPKCDFSDDLKTASGLIERMVAQGVIRRVMEDAELNLIQTNFSDATAGVIKQSQNVVNRTEALRKECRNNGK